MATRVVPLRLARPKPVGDWRKKVADFIAEHRWSLIAEILSKLAGEGASIAPQGRWGEWEAEVLSKVPSVAECQAAIKTRIGDLDDDDAEALEFEDFVKAKLEAYGHKPDCQAIKIPTQTMGEWFNDHEHTNYKAKTATERLEVRPLKRLKYKRTNTERFWLWCRPNQKASDAVNEAIPLGERPPVHEFIADYE